MAYEQIGNGFPGARSREQSKEERLPVADNRVQLAMMDIWNEEKSEDERIPHSELGLTWIEEGLAAKFRAYAEAHPDTKLDIHDEDALAVTLAEITAEPLH